MGTATQLLEITKTRLRRHEGKYAELARQTPGLSYSWLTKFANGEADNPTVGSLQRLIEALDSLEGVVRPQAPPPADPDPDTGRITPFEAPP
jgi:hypothetical protein